MEALGRLHLTVSRAYKVNPDINFEVFIHKVDGLSDDHKIATQRDIHQRANDDLADASLDKLHLRWVSSACLYLEPRVGTTGHQVQGLICFITEIPETERWCNQKQGGGGGEDDQVIRRVLLTNVCVPARLPLVL